MLCTLLPETAGPVALAGLKGALEPRRLRYTTHEEASRGLGRSDGLVDYTNNYTGENCSSQNPTSYIELKRMRALRPLGHRKRKSPQWHCHRRAWTGLSSDLSPTLLETRPGELVFPPEHRDHVGLSSAPTRTPGRALKSSSFWP